MKTNWNATRLAEWRKTLRYVRAVPCSGWKGAYPRHRKVTGYHKFLPLADMRVLTDKLQRQAVR